MKTSGSKSVIRIERSAESQHVLAVGDSGSGKSSVLFSITDEAEALGHTCIIHDPNGYFLRRHYNPERGDVILAAADDRAHAWDPSDEIDYSSEAAAKATALAQATSLYPGNPQRRDWFFTSVARDVHQLCMVKYRASAAELAELYKHPNPLIDAVVKGEALETTMKENSSGTRASIIGTLTTNVLGTLEQIRTPTDRRRGGSLASSERRGWSAREWVTHRKGWIFLTSTQETREACGPLHRLWVDSLIMRFLSMDVESAVGLPDVRMILDELPALGELGQLKMAVAESRKAGLAIVMAFQGRSQVKEIYGESAEAIFSQPKTKVIFRTTEPDAGEWLAKMIGKREVERVREHRAPDGEISYTTDQREEFLVYPSQLAGLKDRCGYLKYENYCAPIKVAYAPPRPDVAPAYVPRIGNPPALLPLPDLDELRAKDDADKLRQAQSQAGTLWQPPKRSKGKSPGPTQDTLFVTVDKSVPINRGHDDSTGA